MEVIITADLSDVDATVVRGFVSSHIFTESTNAFISLPSDKKSELPIDLSSIVYTAGSTIRSILALYFSRLFGSDCDLHTFDVPFSRLIPPPSEIQRRQYQGVESIQ